MKKTTAYILYNIEEHPLPHLGNVLMAHFSERRTRKSSLSRLLKLPPSGVSRYQKKSSLQCNVLWRFSYALNHNFFMDLAVQLPPTFTTNAPDLTLQLQTRNAQLEEENKMLLAKVETIMAVVRKS